MTLFKTPSMPVQEITDDLFEDDPGNIKYPYSVDLSSAEWKLKSLHGFEVVKATALKSIDLSSNRLTELTLGLEYSALKSLKASGNRLSSVSLSCKRLAELDLSSNELTEVPNLFDLVYLRVVRLSGNHITGSFRDFFHLQKLETLELDSNNYEIEDEIQLIEEIKNIANLPLTRFIFAHNHGMKNYRSWIIASIPTVVDIDDDPVTEDEREKAAADTKKFLRENDIQAMQKGGSLTVVMPAESFPQISSIADLATMANFDVPIVVDELVALLSNHVDRHDLFTRMPNPNLLQKMRTTMEDNSSDALVMAGDAKAGCPYVAAQYFPEWLMTHLLEPVVLTSLQEELMSGESDIDAAMDMLPIENAKTLNAILQMVSEHIEACPEARDATLELFGTALMGEEVEGMSNNDRAALTENFIEYFKENPVFDWRLKTRKRVSLTELTYNASDTSEYSSDLDSDGGEGQQASSAGDSSYNESGTNDGGDDAVESTLGSETTNSTISTEYDSEDDDSDSSDYESTEQVKHKSRKDSAGARAARSTPTVGIDIKDRHTRGVKVMRVAAALADENEEIDVHDRLVEVGGVDVRRMQAEEVQPMLVGEEGSSVRVTLSRANHDHYTVDLALKTYNEADDDDVLADDCLSLSSGIGGQDSIESSSVVSSSYAEEIQDGDESEGPPVGGDAAGSETIEDDESSSISAPSNTNPADSIDDVSDDNVGSGSDNDASFASGSVSLIDEDDNAMSRGEDGGKGEFPADTGTTTKDLGIDADAAGAGESMPLSSDAMDLEGLREEQEAKFSDNMEGATLGLNDTPLIDAPPLPEMDRSKEEKLMQLAMDLPEAGEWMQRLSRWNSIMEKNQLNLQIKTDLLNAWRMRLDSLKSRLEKPAVGVVSSVDVAATSGTDGKEFVMPGLSTFSDERKGRDSIQLIHELHATYVTVERQKAEITRLRMQLPHEQLNADDQRLVKDDKELQSAVVKTKLKRAESEKLEARAEAINLQQEISQLRGKQEEHDEALRRHREEVKVQKEMADRWRQQVLQQRHNTTGMRRPDAGLEQSTLSAEMEELVRWKVEAERLTEKLARANFSIQHLEDELDVVRTERDKLAFTNKQISRSGIIAASAASAPPIAAAGFASRMGDAATEGLASTIFGSKEIMKPISKHPSALGFQTVDEEIVYLRSRVATLEDGIRIHM